MALHNHTATFKSAEGVIFNGVVWVWTEDCMFGQTFLFILCLRLKSSLIPKFLCLPHRMFVSCCLFPLSFLLVPLSSLSPLSSPFLPRFPQSSQPQGGASGGGGPPAGQQLDDDGDDDLYSWTQNYYSNNRLLITSTVYLGSHYQYCHINVQHRSALCSRQGCPQTPPSHEEARAACVATSHTHAKSNQESPREIPCRCLRLYKSRLTFRLIPLCKWDTLWRGPSRCDQGGHGNEQIKQSNN